MKIKKWLGVAALATVAGLALAACGNSEKKADNATTIKIATVNRSGSEEARWDKVQELVKKSIKSVYFCEFSCSTISLLILLTTVKGSKILF